MIDIRTKIEAALSRSVCGGWDRGFLESILEQLSKGRAFSTKQAQLLGKVLARNSVEAELDHESWCQTYETEYKSAAMILASYHTRQPYYKPMAQDILGNKVPERRKFLKMYDNKYSKKVLSQHDAIPKYETGAYVMPRATFSSYKDVEFERDMLWIKQNDIVANFIKRGGFVIEVCKEIYSAAKGAKRYKLLPVGQSMPVIVEERYLKRGRVSK